MAGGAETPNIAALPAIARLGACELARGPDADRHVKLLIQFAVEGSLSGAYSHVCGHMRPKAAARKRRPTTGLRRSYVDRCSIRPVSLERLVRRRSWRPTARPGGLCVPRYFRRILSGADGVVPSASSATIYVAVYTPLEARLGAHGRIAAHLAEAMLSEFHTSSGHLEINLSRKARAAVERWAPRR